MRALYLLCLMFVVNLAAAAEVDDAAKQAIAKVLASKVPGAQIESVDKTPIPGVYEVEVEGSVLYMSADGRYAIIGELTDLVAGENLTENKRSAARLKLLEGLDEEKMVIFAAEDPKYTVTVFTDIDCGYCRKLHSEIDEYNKLGITVRYLFYPRSGIGSASYKKAVSVWCAEDRKAAMTSAKQGQVIEEKTCDNPVADDYQLGKKFGVRGTPAMVFSNGKMVPGYLPPKKLYAALVEELGAK